MLETNDLRSLRDRCIRGLGRGWKWTRDYLHWGLKNEKVDNMENHVALFASIVVRVRR